MKSVVLWSDTVPPNENGPRSSIQVLVFSPDSSQVVIGVSNRVIMYGSADGTIIASLSAHKDAVYCLDYCVNGKMLASGAADNTVIIWKSTGEGLLKYTHADSIQSLKFNPVSYVLVSCTANDFGFWNEADKKVTKTRVQLKILCCDWTPDGQYLALGHSTGLISIRDNQGAEVQTISRKDPIWTLAFDTSPDRAEDVLCVGCWDQTISLYNLSGQQQFKDKPVVGNPLCVRYQPGSGLIVVGDSSGNMTLYTRDGIRLTDIKSGGPWMWAVGASKRLFAAGSEDGVLTLVQVSNKMVHAIYGERYCYRDNMTDIIVHHLVNDKKVRIPCKDFVKRLSIYKDRLAVQFPEKILIYELANDEENDMKYRLKRRLPGNYECTSMVVTSRHVIICTGNRLKLFAYEGSIEREWQLESNIRSFKLIGGPAGEEGLFLGLKNGDLIKVFVNNAFIVPVLSHHRPIKCFDISASRKKIAIIDDTFTCHVYDLESKELLFSEPNAKSVAWNMNYENMLCFLGDSILSIRTDNFPLYQQRLEGYVVGFSGSKVFCLQNQSIQTIDVPQSLTLNQYLEKGNFELAYRVACLGVTEHDWRHLALMALQKMEMSIARACLVHVRDLKLINLLDQFDVAAKSGTSNATFFEAEVFAYQNQFESAAKVLCKAGYIDKAIQLFSDMRMWDEAKKFASKFKDSSNDVSLIAKKQAEWAEDVGDWKAAADMYSTAGMYDKAILLLGSHGNMSGLIEVARLVPRAETELLKQCINFFEKNNCDDFQLEVATKVGDINTMMKLYIRRQDWDKAFVLASENKGQFSNDVFLPYAKFLVENDRYDEAQAAYVRAGKPEESMRMLEALTHSAVLERRFREAGYYYFLLSEEHKKNVKNPRRTFNESDRKSYVAYNKYRRLSEIYYAYQFIHQYIEEPFTTLLPEALLNTSRFILNSMKEIQVYGISKVYILHTLAKISKSLECYKLARFAYDKLMELRIPRNWKAEVEKGYLSVQSKSLNDKEEMLPVCYRCGTVNSLINGSSKQGDGCSNCGHPFYHSFVSFDYLPLVEFTPDPSIPESVVNEILESNVVEMSKSGGGGGGGGSNRLNLEDDASPFERLLSSYDLHSGSARYQPVVVSKEVLQTMSWNDIHRIDTNPGYPTIYVKNMISDVPIYLCPKCQHFFHEESYEFAYLQHDCCPICRNKDQ